ncbi:exopolysaccharide biosynthesis polyprenyl glycosylphosphotransferase [Denitrificimonas sp. JX-1]|uniref:Exopolysaccharide biosynthesis polyprenyl glycosylphosphotransferase n=1 Tax=Denitrificimonas halotolerans TaxID=3098930 RepID=A0ABU5GQC8_9GAMM|nr:exopolysaccharide biosynthesis polyprenyl glycosylphosphotransferase [Denitrificimonas sp. JX-1]MDY7218787.1 exopolysaccharide biosynthesis polyprenyl glycosylphosphotransferase [Denitrificimonas sp. JX-1]
MSVNLERRHSRWYEVILFSSLFQFILGFAVVVLLPNWIRWGELLLKLPLTETELNTVIANSIAYAISFFILHKFKRFPGTRSLPFIIPTILTSWLFVLSVLLFLREENYARQVLSYAFILAYVWAFLGYFLGRRYAQPKLALVPYGRALELEDTPHAIVTVLNKADLEGRRYDGIVADLHSTELPAEWERFLASCTLARIPVYHTQQLIESMTGRVKIDHLSENIFGSLLPSGMYSGFKRFFEVLLVLLAAPVWVPIMLLTGIVIKLESDGPMFFIQERVGLRNKDFKVYKLRSMCKDSEKDGAQFAQANDMRITRVGHFIRKTRLDEIPQFINVLKGDMSLIGPRPEQRAFVNQFEKEIPFYSYRHVVRPGITGWAQVVHGYAADADDTQVKIEHDFYYIKHFSLWLDILIVVKTIKTILTGFGAR